jgi:hypothetical protein
MLRFIIFRFGAWTRTILRFRRHSSRSFLTNFCVDSVRFLETMSRVLAPGALWAICPKLLLPVRNVSFPRVLAPLHKRGLTTRHIPPKIPPSPWPLCTSGGREKWAIRRCRHRNLLAVNSTVLEDSCFRLYADDKEAMLIYIYTRLKCRTNFDGVILSLNWT